MKPFGYIWHAESDCAFPVYSEEEARWCCDQGAEMVSEYFCTMVELGLYELIDHEWDNAHPWYGEVELNEIDEE